MASSPEIGRWGFDLAGADPSVSPGEDFARHAGGRWMAQAVIPGDRARWGAFDRLSDRAEAEVRALLDEIAAATHAPGSDGAKVAAFYRAFMDVERIDALGLEPARPGLDAIAAARTHEDVARLMLAPETRSTSPLAIGIALDSKNPDRYAVTLTHGGLGLPERDYYLREDGGLESLRAAHRDHVERMLGLVGAKDPAREAAAVVALETEIARRHWPKARRRERDQTYNPRTLREVSALAPDFPWDAALDAARIANADGMIVRELDAVPALATLFREIPVETWRSHLTFHFVSARASMLPSAIDAESFDFYGRRLSGLKVQRDRWKRAVASVNRSLGDAVGRLYVERHFPAESKAAALDLIENIRRAFRARLERVPWMTEATRAAAIEKLAAFRAKIGFPETWRDYSALEIREGDAFGNGQRVFAFDWAHDVERLGKPADRDEWFMVPQNVNAYYNAQFNEIVFPAAILQPPFFDPAADPAVNYGAIGGVIGHEMGHGFDDQGAKSDGRGILRDWWSAEDVAAFQKLGDALADQYGQFEPLPGLKLDGRVSLGENLADLGGVTLGLEAWRLATAGAPPPVLDGLTGEQRFFLGWAQVWRSVEREESLRNQVMTGPHSPPRYRINGVVRNVDAWYDAFGVKPGDALYLEPGARVRVW